MKKVLLFLTLAISTSGSSYGFFRELAVQEQARREFARKEAEIRAIQEQYIQDAIDTITWLAKGAVYCVTATGKVILQHPTNDTTEKIVGSIGVCSLAAAAVAGLYKLYYAKSEKQSTPSVRIVIKQL